MKRFLLVATCLISAMAAAGAAEKAASAAQIKRLVVGHDLNCGGATCHYAADGSYTYNGQNPGKYKVSGGQICVTFDNGNSRCDKILVDGNSYTLINKDGQRFPFGQ